MGDVARGASASREPNPERAITVTHDDTPNAPGPWGRARWRLFAAGGLLLALATWLALESRSRVFDHGQGFDDRPIVGLVVGLLFASAVWFAVSIAALRRAPPLSWVLLFAFLLRAILLPSRPVQEDDIYRYVWDGKVVAAGLDPYLATPGEVSDFPALPVAGGGRRDRRALLERFEHVEHASEANREILARVNNRGYASIYAPLLQFVFALHGRFVPSDWPAERQITAMKCLLALFDLGLLALLPLLLGLVGLPRGLVVLYAWCPLVLKECANSGHLDAVPAFFVVAALIAAVLAGRTRDSATAIGWALAAGVALALAFGTKLYPLLLVPVVWRRLGVVRGAVVALAFSNVAAVQFGFFPEGAEQRNRVVRLFAHTWENHGAIFLSLRTYLEWLTANAEVSFDVAGVEVVQSRGDQLARQVASACVVFAVLWNTWKTTTRIEAAHFLERCFLVIATLFLVGPVGFPWYFVWLAPLLPFVRRRAWLVLPGILMLYYLQFWFEYRYHDATFSWWVLFDPILLLEVLAFAVILAIEGVLERRRSGTREGSRVAERSTR